VRFAQLRLECAAACLLALPAGEVAREHGGGLALGVALERHADLHGQLAAAGRERRHLAQRGLGGQLGKGQDLLGAGQKAAQRAAQGISGGALEQHGGRGVEDGDALALVHADDGVQRRVDHCLQAVFAGMQLRVALLQRLGAALQRLALGQQRALVDHGAEILRERRVAVGVCFDMRDVQVAGDLPLLVDVKHHFGGFGPAVLPCRRKGGAHARCVLGPDEGHQRDQGPVILQGLERALRHGVGLHHHVVLVQHHERQGHVGKQRLEAFGGAFRRGLAVAQHLVLRLQLGLRGAQLGNEFGHGAAGAPMSAALGHVRLRLRRVGCLRRRLCTPQEEGQVGLAHGGSG